jgi:hypothetical protein
VTHSLQHVRAIHATGADTNQQLTLTRNRHGALGQTQHLRGAMCGDFNDVHHVRKRLAKPN